MIGVFLGVFLVGVFILAGVFAGRARDWYRRRNAPLLDYLSGKAYRYPHGAYYR